MRLFAMLAVLFLAAPALAEAPENDSTAEEDREAKLQRLRAELQAAEEARDAAQVKFFNYGFPQYSLEVEKKNEEMEKLRKEIARLEKEGSSGALR